MKRLFQSYENLLLLIALFIFASVIMANNIKNRGPSNFLERAALTVSSPLQKMVSSAIHETVNTWTHYIDLRNTSEQNDILKKNLEIEQFNNHLLKEELKRYKRIEELVSSIPIQDATMIVADVIGWDSTNMSQTVVLNKGTKDGVQENNIVTSNKGLIGRVVEASATASKVLLITDSRSAVDAYVAESREKCVIVGQNKKTCQILYLPINENAKVGDELISSGLGGVFPKGLRVGKISEISQDSGRLFFKAELLPTADLKHIEEVMIIIKVEKDESLMKKPRSKKLP